jgi:superfamily I DNA/RNA helicase
MYGDLQPGGANREAGGGDMNIEELKKSIAAELTDLFGIEPEMSVFFEKHDEEIEYEIIASLNFDDGVITLEDVEKVKEIAEKYGCEFQFAATAVLRQEYDEKTEKNFAVWAELNVEFNFMKRSEGMSVDVVITPEIIQDRRNFKALLEFTHEAVKSNVSFLKELANLLKAYQEYSRLIKDETTANLIAFLEYVATNVVSEMSEFEGVLADWRRDFDSGGDSNVEE